MDSNEKDSKKNLGSSTAYVYLVDGVVVTFDVCTYPSDLDVYPTIPQGMYEAGVGIHHGSRESYKALRVSDIGTIDFSNNSIELGFTNPAHPSTTKARGINIHKAGQDGLTGLTRDGSPISAGCIVVSQGNWNTFIEYFANDKQRNNIVGITVSRSIAKPYNQDVRVWDHGFRKLF